MNDTCKILQNWRGVVLTDCLHVLGSMFGRLFRRRSLAQPFAQEARARLPSAAVIGIRISHA
jgi:hypothetical protein